MEKLLSRYLSSYPLPTGWGRPELFVEELVLMGKDIPFHLTMVGLSCENQQKQLATGSAAGKGALERAFFELLERTSILEMEQKMGANPPGTSPLITRDMSGMKLGELMPSQLFPTSPCPQIWVYSKSNGTAVDLTFSGAAKRALGELCERDRVLAAWFGQNGHLNVRPSQWPQLSYPPALSERFEMVAVQFGKVAHGPIHMYAAGVFGFPKDKLESERTKAPLVYGFGSGQELTSALDHAYGECLQRLGFLWNEELPGPQELTSFIPSPSSHQDYFLRPKGEEKIKSWLGVGEGGHFVEGPAATKILHSVSFVDMTPSHLQGRLWVVKAISPDLIPLTFGKGHPWSPAQLGLVEEEKEDEINEILIHPVL